ncbi:hypothetical protein BDZ94DRAFT_1258240 [Collybia nuda]|uniref:Uncharacterized protein n=1 Tax=Collybia nuda TaxID=64659 RepID=A0A9P6CF39_9AGAR|nr:hypothetical protein BDZ94DRAFT_1258240 [Collybia nuda]
MPPSKSKAGRNSPFQIIGRMSWNSTSRMDRAMIRILAAHGLNRAAIANHVGFTVCTVRNILEKRVGGYAGEDESLDYNYVGDVFKAVYPPLPTSGNGMEVPKVEVAEVNISEVSLEKMKQNAVVSSSGTRSVLPPQNASLFPPAVGSSSENPIVMYETHPKVKFSGRKSEPIEVDLDLDPSAIEVIQAPSQPILEFLSYLDHDLSGIFNVMKNQELGTLENLFSIAHWPGETLHRLFKEALLDMSITQRFVLVRGLKDRARAGSADEWGFEI